MAAYGTSILISLAVSLATTAISMGVQALLAPNIKGPRQKDSGIQGSDYGRPIPLVYGPSNRLAGTVIFYSGLQEQKRKKSGSGGSQTTFTYSCTVAILIGQGIPGALLSRIWANKKPIYENDELVATGKIKHGEPVLVAESVTFYDGNGDQLPDPTLEEYKGVGNVPGYRHSMYVVIKNLQLADFGPTCPYFDIELRAHDEISPGAVVADMGLRAGVTIDVSGLEGNVGLLDGYVVDSDISVSDAMIPLCVAYSFDIAERGADIVAVPRGMGPVATIPAGDMAAREGEPKPGFSKHDRTPEAELPSEVAVTYRDLFRDLQPLTQRATRNLGNARENLSVDLPLSLDPDQARRIAARILWATTLGRRTAKTSVTDRWLDVLPGDIVNLETPTGAFLPHRLSKATRGSNAITEWELAYEDNELYTCNVIGGSNADTGISGGDGSGGDGDPGQTVFIPMDIPFLRAAHDNAGFYWAVIGSASAWAAAQSFRSTDGGTDYDSFGAILGGATTGTVAAATPAGPTVFWDRATVITVLMDRDGELESKSQESVLNGSNVFWIGPASGIGGEIGQFVNATMVGPKTWEISLLLRGRRGTEWAVGRHAAGERFVLLSDSAQIGRQDFGAADLDQARLYKSVAMLTSIDDAEETSFTNTGEALRCLSPAHLVGRRNVAGDLAVTWFRRTRLLTSGIGTPAPLGEEDETYQVDFYRAASAWSEGESVTAGQLRREISDVDYGWHWYEALLDHETAAANRPDGVAADRATYWLEIVSIRSLQIADQTNYTYPAAEMASDGITPGMEMNLQCRQRSAVRSFGHPALAVA